ncbi:MAG: two-component regulator propeller domain-containing protein [Thermonemataceae bacterium]|nr:two-component regulator propeller domain-containing protein [Thermonemataceae bacterium]
MTFWGRYIVGFVVSWSIALNGFSQKYRFFSYGSEQGLPQSEVLDIYQDSRGSIWVATNGGGAARFNGKNFKVFDDTKGLVHNRVKKIFEDSKKNLWFLTERGISIYNGQKFTNYTQKDGIPNSNAYQVCEDKQGVVWFLLQQEQGGAKIISYKESVFIDFTLQHLFLTKDNQIYNIALHQQNLLIQTQKGFFEFDGNKLSISPLTKLLAGKNTILYGCDKAGLAQIFVENYRNKQVELYTYSNHNLSLKHSLSDFKLQDLLSFTEDKEGRKCFSVRKKGIFSIFDGEIENYTTKNGLETNTIDVIFADNNANVWLSSYGRGLFRFKKEAFVQFYNEAGLETGMIWAINQDKEGNLWIGESGEQPFLRFDRDKFLPIKTPKDLLRVKTIRFSEKGDVLLATPMGLWTYQGATLKNISRAYNLPDSLHITSITVAKKGIYFATYQDGVYFFDKDTKKTLHYTKKNKNIVSDLVNDVFEDSSGKVWIGTIHGISIINGNKIINHTLKNGLPRDYVAHITEDKNGYIWVATLGGLLRYKSDNQNFTLFSEREGLLSNNIYAILADSKNQLWLGTQLGVTQVLLNDKSEIIKIKNYDRHNSIAGVEANERAIFEDKTGNIWIGTVKGLLKYTPTTKKQTEEEQANISVQITDLQLFLQNTDWLSTDFKQYHKGLIPWTSLPQNLSLPHNKNYLSFHFEVNNYEYVNRIKYQWILEGLEKEWTNKSRKTEVVYTNLPPGTYTFKVRACLSGNCTEYSSYTFTIKAAFWQTWWFYVLIVLLLILLALLLIRQRFQLIREQQKNLKAKIAEAKQTLVEQNDALKVQTEELEKQRLAFEQLNHTKDKFLSILAHDIKSPLNSLTAFLNIMTHHLDEMSREDIVFMSANLSKSVKNLYNLLENLLSWSRSQMGVLEYHFDAVNLHALIQQNVELLDMSAKQKGILLVNQIPKDIEVWADANTLNTIVRNLISNAIKFTSIDGKVSVMCQINNNSEVKVFISDTGVGMSQEVLDKILRIDTRHSTKGTANETGTGLGLVLVKEFVEKNKGKIEVKSVEGKGTTFAFTIPLTNHKETENK